MKKAKIYLSIVLALVLLLGQSTFVLAADGSQPSGFGGIPAGEYIYVSGSPADGQIQFIYEKDMIVWTSGQATLSGSELKFFQGLYLSDLPVTDWFGGDPKDTEGYAGDVAGNVKITLTETGKISKINIASPTTRVTAVLSKDITDTTLTVQGSTRGKPNLMQSCITLLGSTNALYLTVQGDVILNGLAIGNDGAGVGLTADKIGGDTFVAGTVSVDGKVEWHNKMGVITALESQPGTLITNDYDISMTGGSNIGRVGRVFNISTGEGKGDIILGATVTTDSTRGGLLPNADTSTDRVTISDSGSITAGLGDVIIGTNTEKAVNIDVIGEIQGANVIIKPTVAGVPANVVGWIGNITATENIEIEIGTVNSGNDEASRIGTSTGTEISQVETGYTDDASAVVIDSLTAKSGDISLTAGAINGVVGDITAPNGTVNVTIESVNAIGAVTGAKVNKNVHIVEGQTERDDSVTAVVSQQDLYIDGVLYSCEKYNIDDYNYFKLRDLAALLSGTPYQFDVDFNASTSTVYVTTNKAYTQVGGELAVDVDKSPSCVKSDWKLVVNDNPADVAVYNLGGNNYFKLRDLADAIGFDVDFDEESNAALVGTVKSAI